MTDFEDIRSYRDSEVPAAIRELVKDPAYPQLAKYVFPERKLNEITKDLLAITTIREFQEKISYPIVHRMVDPKTEGIKMCGTENMNKQYPYLFISNHRDITLDAAILNVAMHEAGILTTEIAIGDNLMVQPWIMLFIKLNRGFLVRRNLPVRETLLASRQLSAYIRNTLSDRKISVWLAQREGRTKDSNDTTQESILKMLNMSGNADFLTNLETLSICPLSISYEYDPCDFLKAQEFQLKRDNPDYKKTGQDDLLSMLTGINGYKGKVVYRFGFPIKEEIKTLYNRNLDKREQITEICTIIDRQIHANYEIYNTNKIAYDLLLGENRFTKEYDEPEKTAFCRYVQEQLTKVNIPDKDEAFLTNKMLKMYANPLINYLKAVI